MKPSDKIKEIYEIVIGINKFLYRDDNLAGLASNVMAIISYLDEEWEKNQKPLPKIEAQITPV